MKNSCLPEKQRGHSTFLRVLTAVTAKTKKGHLFDWTANNRDDKTPLELFLASLAGWDAVLRCRLIEGR